MFSSSLWMFRAQTAVATSAGSTSGKGCRTARRAMPALRVAHSIAFSVDVSPWTLVQSCQKASTMSLASQGGGGLAGSGWVATLSISLRMVT